MVQRDVSQKGYRQEYIACSCLLHDVRGREALFRELDVLLRLRTELARSRHAKVTGIQDIGALGLMPMGGGDSVVGTPVHADPASVTRVLNRPVGEPSIPAYQRSPACSALAITVRRM